MNLKTIYFQYLSLFLGLILFILPAFQARAADGFVVEDIQVQGLQRINLGTVLNYLPVEVGQRLEPGDTNRIIRTLYDTGFFENIELEQEGSTLIIVVVERATIGSISLSGNSDIKTEQLNDVLSQMGLEEGEIFQLSALDLFEQDLRTEYNNRGKYNVIITSTVSPLSQNRVAININISEGTAAKIKAVNIIGNNDFSDGELLQQFNLSTPNLFKFTFITGADQYSQEKLDASLEALNSFYMDRGYIRFRIESTQVLLSPDKKDVYIAVKIYEGPQYTFSGYQLTGELVVPEEAFGRIIDIQPGEVYSYQKVTEAITYMGEALSSIGYGFPDIQVEPTINDSTREVFITFIINPGRHVYVRQINFSGNTRTSDEVLRRNLFQNEGSVLLLGNVRESERQLRILRYLEDVNVETVPVPGSNNEVDLNFNVTEAPSAEAYASVGYGTNGFELNAGLDEYNFMGTGKNVGFNFITSLFVTSYTVNYFNPYYTVSGIGRGFNAYFNKFTPGRLDIAGFATDRFGGNVVYSYLLSNTVSAQFGYGYEHLNIVSDGGVTQIINFINESGKTFDQARITGGLSSNSYDRFPFPTQGVNQQVTGLAALPAAKNALKYYKLTYVARYYKPLVRDFLLTALASFGYGDRFDGGGLPFYENFYAGGIADPGQVRGFDSYSLGPRDNFNNPLGGNILINGSLGLILPYPISRDSLRVTGFVDAGNVYSRGLPFDQEGTFNTGSGPIRYSAGVSAEWRSPFGPLLFSIALPVNPQEGDRLEPFQFTLSTGF